VIDIFFPSIKIKSDYIIKKLLYAIHYIYKYDNDINYTNKKLAELIPNNIEKKKNLNHIINFINIVTNISLFRESSEEKNKNEFIEDVFTSCDNLFMEYSEHSASSRSSISSGSSISSESSVSSESNCEDNSSVSNYDDSVGSEEIYCEKINNISTEDNNPPTNNNIDKGYIDENYIITDDNNHADDDDNSKVFKEFLYKNKDFLIDTCKNIENKLNDIQNKLKDAM
jgi:hypothetical protein